MNYWYLDTGTLQVLIETGQLGQFLSNAEAQGITVVMTDQVEFELGKGTPSEAVRDFNKGPKPGLHFEDDPFGLSTEDNAGDKGLIELAKEKIKAGHKASIVLLDGKAVRGPFWRSLPNNNPDGTINTDKIYVNKIGALSLGEIPPKRGEASSPSRSVIDIFHPNGGPDAAEFRDAVQSHPSVVNNFPSDYTAESYARFGSNGPEQKYMSPGERPPGDGWLSRDEARARSPGHFDAFEDVQRRYSDAKAEIFADPANYTPDGAMSPAGLSALERVERFAQRAGIALLAADVVSTAMKIDQFNKSGQFNEADLELAGFFGRWMGGYAGFAVATILGPAGWAGFTLGILGSVAGAYLGDLFFREGTHWLQDQFGVHFFRLDPLVLDLDRNGIQLIDLSGSNIKFDLDGDGFRERTGWVSAGDGLLVLDRNQNGQIDDGTELFGSAGVNGFEDLRDYDANHDNIINSLDPIFSSLRVWRDANGDGISQSSEIVTLNDPSANVVSINLSYEDAWVFDNINGNSVLAYGSFTDGLGQIQQSVSVAFTTDQVNTAISLPVGFTFDPDILLTPNLRGYGSLPDLWVAMSLDETLKNMVLDLIAEQPESLEDLVGDKEKKFKSIIVGGHTIMVPVDTYEASAFEDILARWAGVTYGDAFTDGLQMQGIVEKLMNRLMLPGSRLTPENVEWIDDDQFYDVYRDFTTQYAVRFLAGLSFVEQNSASLALSRDIAKITYPVGSTEYLDAVSDLIDLSENALSDEPQLSPLLKHYANLNYDISTDGVGGDVSQFISEELTNLSFDASNPWDDYDQWFDERSSLLATLDPTGEILRAAHRVYTQNYALPILRDTSMLVLQGTTGDDALTGTSASELIHGSSGSDILIGGLGSDTYLFRGIWGSSTISDVGGDNDEIAFQGIYTSEKAVLAYANLARTDLKITFSDASGSVVVENYFGPGGLTSIETLSFGDGRLVSAYDVRSAVLRTVATSGNDQIEGYDLGSAIVGFAGDDTIVGKAGTDVLIGGVGNDRLEGGGGNDVYLFSRGDGQDVIYDNNEGWWYGNFTLFDGGTDRIKFDFSVSQSDVVVQEIGSEDLLIRINGTNDQILLKGAVSTTQRRIEVVEFYDGTVWTHSDLMQRALAATQGDDVFFAGALPMQIWGGEGNDVLTGSDGNDELYGGLGTDALVGGLGNDILDGGEGSDDLRGGAGDDVYRFGVGNGQDTIYDNVIGPWYGDWKLFDGGNDSLEMEAGINPADIDVIEQGADDLLLKIRGTEDQILLQGVVSATERRIEAVRFADGIVWNHADLMQRALVPTSGNDIFYAGTLPMAFSGGEGNDTLTGSDGVDTISGDAGDDAIDGRDGNDMLSGGAGNDVLKGGGGADDLAGGTGNDRLEGASGDDVYRFNVGDSSDTIFDDNVLPYYGDWKLFDGGNDRLELGVGMDPADIDVVEQGTDDLLLQVRGTSDQILLKGVVSATERRIETVRFADGTVWSHADLMQRALNATAGDDVFYAGTLPMAFSGGEGNDALTGSDGIDTISGDAGNDMIDGRGGDDILSGGAGNDILKGGSGADDLSGDTGTDRLEGASGDDVYRFKLGDGSDTIFDDNILPYYGDWKLFDGGNDRLELGVGIDPVDINVVEQGADDLLLKVRGTSDQILLKGVVSATERRIETVRFADGTAWSHADLMQRALVPTLSDDIFYAGTLPMTLSGGDGNDTLTGSDGIDTISGDAGNDMIDGRDGNDVLSGGAGNDIVKGGSGADDLAGGTGTDRLEGASGDDVYRFNLGDGSDTIYDNNEGVWYGSWTLLDGGNDSLILGAGINPADIDVLEQGTDDLLLKVRNTSDQILLQGVNTASQRRIEAVRFADGTVWSHEDLVQRSIGTNASNDPSVTIAGTSGIDNLYGTQGADVFQGKGGNDYLAGGIGNDTYIYRSGDGADHIWDYNAGVADSDTLKLVDLGPNDVELRRTGDHLYIKDLTTSQEVWVEYHFHSSTQDAIEKIEFADGTIWDQARITQETGGSGTPAGERIDGTSGSDIFIGKGGDDFLVGGAGNDKYIYRSGDGSDHIYDYNAGAADTDTLELVDLTPSQVSLRRLGDHLYVKDLTTDQEIWIEYHFHSSTQDAVENIKFADGTIWDLARIKQEAPFIGTSAAETIDGTSGADIMVGGLGDDTLRGGLGDDVYIYASGDGNDVVYDYNAGVNDNDVLKFTDLNPEDLIFRRSGDHLYIKDITTGQEIQGLYHFYANNQAIIDRVEFADGTVWNQARIAAVAATVGNDVLLGTSGQDWLRGLDGNDTLTGYEGNDYLDGGVGSDTAIFRGNSTEYTLATISGAITINDDQSLTNGDDGTDTLVGVETASFKDISISIAAPIVLDLNGDGVTLVHNRNTNVSFDWNSDGLKDQTGWIGRDDGFLFLDRDQNGTVTNGGELSFTSDKPGAKSDLDGLRAFDSNGDGQFSTTDDRFSEFKIWRDKNSNGEVDQKEIISLEEAGVASIDLVGEAVNQAWDWGENLTINTGSFVRTNGTTGTFGDVAFSYDASTRAALTSGHRISSPGDRRVALTPMNAAAQLAEAIAGFGIENHTTEFAVRDEGRIGRESMLAISRSSSI